MLKRLVSLAAFALMLSFCPESQAMDYSMFSNKELLELKGAVERASKEEQAIYAKEWDGRLQKMSSEEREYYEDALLTSEAEKKSNDDKKKVPVIQGKGYEKGEGIIIFGGPSTGNKP